MTARLNTADDLLKLPGAEPLAVRVIDRTGCRKPTPPKKEELVIPAPMDGVTYTYSEVAAFCGCARGTICGWVAKRGLKSLKLPKGHISPGALCAFLEEANDVSVSIRG